MNFVAKNVLKTEAIGRSSRDDERFVVESQLLRSLSWLMFCSAIIF